MKNNSRVNHEYFQFTVFSDYGPLKYLFFCLSLLIYATIAFANLMVIITISHEKSLHQPMYIFICCLCVNSLFGTSGFFPRFLMDLLSDTHWISRLSCLVQVYVIYSYAATEMMILSIMAYDRHVAISEPLHYHSKMTFNVILGLIVLAVCFPAFSVGLCVVLGALLPLCRYKLNRIFCVNVVVLTCVDATASKTVGTLLLMLTIFIPMAFLLYTYLHILSVCKKSSTEIRGKALQTCLPHILTFLIYSLSFFCEVILSRSKPNEMHPSIIIILSLEFLTIPPISNPLVYGLCLPQIREATFKSLNILVKYPPSLNQRKSNLHS